MIAAENRPVQVACRILVRHRALNRPPRAVPCTVPRWTQCALGASVLPPSRGPGCASPLRFGHLRVPVDPTTCPRPVIVQARPVAAAPAAGVAARQPFLPYSDGSFFRSSVRGAPVDRTATASFRSFMRSHYDQRSTRHPLVNGTDDNLWGTAYAMGHARHPVWTLTGAVPPEVAVLGDTGFHAPAWLGQTFSGHDVAVRTPRH